MYARTATNRAGHQIADLGTVRAVLAAINRGIVAESARAATLAAVYKLRRHETCGRKNNGHPCTMPAGSSCPDCGPSCHSMPEGA